MQYMSTVRVHVVIESIQYRSTVRVHVVIELYSYVNTVRVHVFFKVYSIETDCQSTCSYRMIIQYYYTNIRLMIED